MNDQPVPQAEPGTGTNTSAPSRPRPEHFYERWQVILAAIGVLLAVIGILVQVFFETIPILFGEHSTATPIPGFAQTQIDFVITQNGIKQTFGTGSTLELQTGDIVFIETKVSLNGAPYPHGLSFDYFSAREGKLIGLVPSYAPQQAGSDILLVMITDQETREQVVKGIYLEVREDPR